MKVIILKWNLCMRMYNNSIPLINSSTRTVTLYGGSILRFLPSPYWRGSPWEGAEIRWDGEWGSQIISMFEIKGEGGVPGLPKTIRNRLIKEIKEMMEQPYASRNKIFVILLHLIYLLWLLYSCICSTSSYRITRSHLL